MAVLEAELKTLGIKGLDGTWTWRVGLKDQALHFSIEGDELVATSSYGTFRGGEIDGVLVLCERIEGPGPPSTTWVNLAPSAPGVLAGSVMAAGGMDVLTRVTVRKLGTAQ